MNAPNGNHSGNSGDWQVGDLALCVKLGPWKSEPGCSEAGPQAGSICTVKWIEAIPVGLSKGKPGLVFEEWADGFAAKYFRKIPPHKADAEDRETIALLNGKPVREDA